MSRKQTRLPEANMKLYFLMMAVFCAAALWAKPVLGAAEAAVMLLVYVYFRRTAVTLMFFL